MSSQATVSYVENQRLSHVQLEAYEEYLTNLLLGQGGHKIHRERLANELRASNLLNRLVNQSRELLESYDDQDGLRKQEMDTILNGNQGSGSTGEESSSSSSTDEFAEFYQRLNKIKDYHTRHPSNLAKTSDIDPVDFTELEGGGIVDGRDFMDRMFTGEESLGRYLDLNSLHERYNNLPGQNTGTMKRVNYLQYLDDLVNFSKVPKEKKGEQYLKYLNDMFEYIKSFFERALPMSDLDQILRKLEEEFESKWPQGNIEGWDVTDTKDNNVHGEGVWCPACQRTFAKQTVYDAHLTSKKHVKAAQRLEQEGNQEQNGQHGQNGQQSTKGPSRSARNKQIALLEYELNYLLSDSDSPLSSIRSETKSNVERKQALTGRERQLEIEEQELRERKEAEEAARAAEKKAAAQDGGQDQEEEDEDDEDDDEKIYNPLKLPLGWDGKPIPYWLYKLHGLGVEYNCEICNHSYMGRKNFERHFQEQRHSFGMRALGLPNTKHFYEITKIEDALALASKLKAEGQAELSQAEQAEELEDSEGNVYSRKVYEDLRKQGLLQ